MEPYTKTRTEGLALDDGGYTEESLELLLTELELKKSEISFQNGVMWCLAIPTLISWAVEDRFGFGWLKWIYLICGLLFLLTAVVNFIDWVNAHRLEKRIHDIRLALAKA